MKLTDRLLAAAALAGAASGAVAGDIEGRVAALGGAPVAEAVITVTPGARTATSDEHGHFRISGLEAGEYVLDFRSAQGVETRRVTVTEDDTSKLTVWMLGSTALDKVIVSASPLNRSVLDVAQPVTVLADDELRKQIANNIGETLDDQLGVNSTYFGPGASRPVIRGLAGARVRVQEDGISAMDASSVSPDHAVGIEPILVDRIEIIRGPATLLYGSGAFGGVVNLVDNRIPEKLPAESLHGAFESRAESATGERALVARAEGALGRLAWHADAYRRETDNIEIPGFAESAALRAEEAAEGGASEEETAGELENSDTETDGGALGFSWIADDAFLGISVSNYNTNYGVPGHHHEEEPAPGMPVEEEPPVRIDLEQVRYDIKSEWGNPLPGLSRAKFRLGYNDYEHVELEGTETGTIFTNREFEGRLELVHNPWGTWDGAFGVQFGNRDFSAVGEEAFVPPVETRNAGLFIVEERPVGDWQLALGARYDRQRHSPENNLSRSDSATSLSAGMVRKLADEYSFSVNLIRAQRMPSAEELYSNGPHLATQSFEMGNPDLDVETARNLDVTFRKYAGGMRVNLSLFRNKIADYIYQQNTGVEMDGLPVFVYTQQDATFSGLEFETVFGLMDNGIGELDLRLFTDYVQGELDNGETLPRLPPRRYGVGLDFKQTHWTAGLSATEHADVNDVAAFERPTDGYTMLNADVSYRLFTAASEWFVFLRGTNLLDEEARKHTSFLKDLAPLPGRSFTLGLRGAF